jgi:hypothetical protein
VQVYRFQEEDTSRFALTRDRGGARLPVEGSVWRYAGPLDLDEPELVGATLQRTRVAEAILKKGCFIWPDDSGPDGGD